MDGRLIRMERVRCAACVCVSSRRSVCTGIVARLHRADDGDHRGVVLSAAAQPEGADHGIRMSGRERFSGDSTTAVDAIEAPSILTDVFTADDANGSAADCRTAVSPSAAASKLQTDRSSARSSRRLFATRTRPPADSSGRRRRRSDDRSKGRVVQRRNDERQSPWGRNRVTTDRINNDRSATAPTAGRWPRTSVTAPNAWPSRHFRLSLHLPAALLRLL